ncbi:MAG: putative quinol monooxygenase [Sphingobium sp.]
MIHVIAVITAKPGKRQAMLDELNAIIPTIHAEVGCIEYTVTIDAPAVGDMHTQSQFGPDSFICIEKWESLEYLKAHSTAQFVLDYFPKVGPIMADRTVHFLQTA